LRRIFLDFETRSAADLKKIGSWEYSRHHSTRVNCMAWAVGDGAVNIWAVGDKFPRELHRYINDGCEMHAWNAQFERHMWQNCMYNGRGWPKVDFEQWRCTAAKSRHANHPGALVNAAKLLLPDMLGKDADGNRIMRLTASPQKWTKKEIKEGNTGLKWVEDPITMALVESYCIQDVRVERAIDKILPPWPEEEIKVWQMNERINDRGVPLDRELCVASNDILKQNLVESSAKISKLTDGVITTGNQIQRIKTFVNERGVNVDSLAADIVEWLLEGRSPYEITEEVRDVLQMRQICAGAAAKKFKSAVEVISDDDRGRGLFMYYGGLTGRFASLKTQIQNMKHGSDTTDTFRDAVVSCDLGLMHTLYADNIIGELGRNVRSMVCAPEGHTLVRCDSSQIECRVLHWLAGNKKMLDLFQAGVDPYCNFASMVYNRKVTKKDKEKRQLGKASTLGLGFGMGAGRFVGSAAGYGVEITEKFSKYVVDLWRADNSLVLKFWKNIETAAKACVARGQAVRVGHLVFRMDGDYLTVVLPSGRRLFYYQPKFVGEGRDIRFQYTSNRGVRNEWAGGLICENVVQAVARDTLVLYMSLAEKCGLDIVAHIHDEIMVQARLEDADYVEKTLMECFSFQVPWMEGLPCAAEATVWRRYAG